MALVHSIDHPVGKQEGAFLIFCNSFYIQIEQFLLENNFSWKAFVFHWRDFQHQNTKHLEKYWKLFNECLFWSFIIAKTPINELEKKKKKKKNKQTKNMTLPLYWMNVSRDNFNNGTCEFEILAFPCNQFGREEPGVDEYEVLHGLSMYGPVMVMCLIFLCLRRWMLMV